MPLSLNRGRHPLTQMGRGPDDEPSHFAAAYAAGRLAAGRARRAARRRLVTPKLANQVPKPNLELLSKRRDPVSCGEPVRCQASWEVCDGVVVGGGAGAVAEGAGAFVAGARASFSLPGSEALSGPVVSGGDPDRLALGDSLG